MRLSLSVVHSPTLKARTAYCLGWALYTRIRKHISVRRVGDFRTVFWVDLFARLHTVCLCVQHMWALCICGYDVLSRSCLLKEFID